MNGEKIISSRTPESLESGARENRSEYCSQTSAFVQFFFFRTHDRTPGKKKAKKGKNKKEEPGRSSGSGEEAPARDGAILGVELDAEEAASGELSREQRGARTAKRIDHEAAGTRERLDERCQDTQRFLRRMQTVERRKATTVRRSCGVDKSWRS